MGDRERHGEVGERQARLPGERDELLDGVDTALVVDVLEEAGPSEFVPPALADAPREQSLPERAPHQRAHPTALGDRQRLAFDAAVEQGVRRLLRVEPFQPAPLGDPLGFDGVGRRHHGRPDRTDLPLRIRPESAESVSSTSVVGSGGQRLESRPSSGAGTRSGSRASTRTRP